MCKPVAYISAILRHLI